MSSFRCIVADDHPAIIDAVWRFLEDEEEVELLGRAGDGERALALIERVSPDDAVLDIRMPALTGIEVARKLHAAGGTYVDPALAGLLAGPQATERLPALTKREREVLRLLADGMRNEQVASHLSISPLTVRTHVKKAMEKLEADTRTQAVARALRESLIA